MILIPCPNSGTYKKQVATIIAVYANWGFARIHGIGWGWAGVIWLYSIITYIPLDVIKFAIRYALTGKAWNTLLQNKVRNTMNFVCSICHSIYFSFLFFFFFGSKSLHFLCVCT
jgi:hypothetical protein